MTETCPECDQAIPLATVFLYPDGDTQLIANHGTDAAARCDGSLRSVSGG